MLGNIEYRDIPGFPDYVIGEDTVIRNRHTGREMRVYEDGSVHLRRRGQIFHRSHKTLYWRAFSDRENMQTTYVPGKEGRRLIDEFPSYEMDRSGAVFSRETGRQKSMKYGRGTMYYTFSSKGRRYTRNLLPLLERYFPEENHRF